MKHYKNTMEEVLGDLQSKIRSQNLSHDLFGIHSTEFQVDRIILNTTLETLQRSNYIVGYEFNIIDSEIKELVVIFGTAHKAFISDTDYEIY